MVRFLALIIVICGIFGALVQSQQVSMTTKPPSNKSSDYPYCFRFTWLGEKFDRDSEIKNLTCETFRGDLKNVPCRKPLVATTNSKEPNTALMWKNFQKKPLEIGCRLVRGESCIKYSYIYNHAANSKEPNTALMWKNFQKKPLEIGCRLVRGESCIKYSYIYNHAANSKEPNTALMWKNFQKKPLEIGCRLVRGESCIKYSYIYNHAVENITYMCAKANASNGCYTQKQSAGREVEVCICESSAGSYPCFTSTAGFLLDRSIAPIVYTAAFFITLFILNI